jgi:N-acetylmuramoyl-L-alanine amidase
MTDPLLLLALVAVVDSAHHRAAPRDTMAAVSATDAISATAAARGPARRYTVVVDAGHGGPDPGMHGPIGGHFTIYEKDITLAVSKKLARDLENRGVNVVMTRSTDTLIALGDRGRIANEHRGDLFISIHVNAANLHWKSPGSARGFETYFLSEARTEDERRVAAMENDAVRYEDGSRTARDDALGFILSDMRQNEHLRESNDLAETVQARLARIHPGPNRGVQQAQFVVLVTAFMPSVLVEIGFGTNPGEAAFISSAEGEQTIAAAVAAAAMEYLAHYERRVGGTGGISPGARE